MKSIAIIDVIGLTYDGDTLKKRGLGGSESAVILMSKELVKLGFDVTVFNNCIDKESSEGLFEGVNYVDLTRLHENNDFKFDIVISSRTIIPFLQERYWPHFQHNPHIFKKLKDNAQMKIVWMHDTFCMGDHLLEEHVVNGDIDELFTLSDFHMTYVSNCDHGNKRNYEVIKNKIFLTRNGAVQHVKNVDISKKDPNLFVYNASVTKGMIPLVEDIWPRVKHFIPDAKLKIIGGFYRFREEQGPDEQENKFWDLYKRPNNAELNIEFTGIIRQDEIAQILADASYFIFPVAFPETFGISSVEALLHNTPLLTCRFGAVEETGLEMASYFINYAIEPNGLFPNINKMDQINRFVDMTVHAYNDKYLHQQKMYYCNLIKDISGWDSVALQWKQHLFKKSNLNLPVEEYRKVKHLNYKVHKFFGRRNSNHEEWVEPKSISEQKIVIISPFWNAEKYIERCIRSVAAQDYDNYHHILINDCSTDNSLAVAQSTIQSLSENIRDKFTVISNTQNMGAVYNQISMIRPQSDDDIIMLLDGDDWLFPENDIFDYYNNLYKNGTEYSYGSCWSLADNIPLIAQPYPQDVIENKSFRTHQFNWGIPYTHLRTFRKKLLDNVDDSVFKNDKGDWFRAGGDVATFYNIIEQATKITTVTRIVYVYNDVNPLNDYKINGTSQTENANYIKKGTQSKMKKILIAIPTAKYIETETFKSIYDLIIPDGYETEFQCFYGYNIDQVRNLIASWAVNYDYLFSVDSDIAFAPDTLVKLLNHNKDMVSGLYIQRIPGQHVLELYREGRGNIPYEEIAHRGLVPVDGCGFGCVLVKSEVIRAIGYPQFVYKSAIDHKDTISEDVYFCTKAREKGFKIFADTSILCRHIGASTFLVKDIPAPNVEEINRLRELGSQWLIPKDHYEYLINMKNTGKEPKVIFDIGACVLHWTKLAKTVWPDSNYFCFESMEASEQIFKENGVSYCIATLGDVNGREVDFYENVRDPGGNSYYRENSAVNPEAEVYFNESNRKRKLIYTLDSIVEKTNWPQPDLIKIDVQGAEMDVLKGAQKTLVNCRDLILELQKVEYNKGAPLREEVIRYVEGLGFKLKSNGPFSDNGPDGDYHFSRD